MALVKFGLMLSLGLLTTYLIQAELPKDLAETIQYKKSRDRTFWLVREGSLAIHALPAEEENADMLRIQIDYSLQPIVGKLRKQSEEIAIHLKYLEPEFLSTLIEGEEIATENFKVQYLGTETKKNQDGQTYKDCRIFRFTEIKYTAKPVNGGKSYLSRLNNMQVTVAISELVPGFGIVQFDFTGNIFGIRFRVGVDYLRE